VLWNGGISFGGVTAFIFADLIIIPILVIYRKYYGTKMMLAIAGIFYAAMVLAAYVVEFAFGGLPLIPATRAAKVTAAAVSWAYTTVLNIIFLLLAAELLVRFFRSGGPMLKMMGDSRCAPAPGSRRERIRNLGKDTMDVWRAALEDKVTAERELAAARGEQYARVIDIGPGWDVGAPPPQPCRRLSEELANLRLDDTDWEVAISDVPPHVRVGPDRNRRISMTGCSSRGDAEVQSR
jgi:hypothetical protein